MGNKRNHKRVLLHGIVILTILLLMAPMGASAASISTKAKRIWKGQTFALKVKGVKKSKVKWSSSNRAVATVNAEGLVKGKKKGIAIITARVGNKSYRCRIGVRQPVNRIKLSKKSVSVKKGKSVKLGATVKPASADNRALSWTSSNESIAVVNSKGKVKGKSEGNAIITARAKDGSGVVSSCMVTVKGPQKPLVITPGSLQMMIGDYRELSASVNASWASTNQAVATVAQNGTVIATGIGTAQIMAMSSDGSQIAYCTVTVQTETAPSAMAQKLLNVLERYSQDIRANKVQGRYLAYSNSSKLNPSSWNAALNTMNSRGISYSNCALMVRMALRELGRLGENQNFWGDGSSIHFNAGVRETLELSCRIFQVNKTPDELLAEGGLLPGDICTWNGKVHTNVYAGNGLWYDAGRGSGDGGYMTHKQIREGGVVTKAVLKQDKKNDNNNPKLDGDIYVFNSLGPCAGVNMASDRIAWIIRLLR